jgi:transcriptional regulator with PAS, ATPase and Fis domain
VTLARRASLPAAPPPGEILATAASLPEELAAELWLALAVGSRESGDPPRASAWLDEARRRAAPGGRMEALCKLEAAEVSLARREVQGARALFQEGLEGLRRLGLVIEEGRALLRYGEAVGAGVPDPEAAAVWLARAEKCLGDAATFRDRARLRAGFHRHGRRLPDQALTSDALDRVGLLERAAASLRGAVLAALDQVDRQRLPSAHAGAIHRALGLLQDSLDPRFLEIRRVGTDLLDLLGAASVERNRTRSLLLATAGLDRLDSVGALAAASARVLRALLDAERVALVRRLPGGEAELLGADVPPGEPLDALRDAAFRALQEAAPSSPPASMGPEPARRSERRMVGPWLRCSLGVGAFRGVFVAEKRRGAQFSEFDQDLARIFAQYLGQGFDRLLAREAETVALAELSATLDAIRDGVLSVDPGGVVRGANATAARLLQVNQQDLVGVNVDTLPSLGALRGLLVPARRVDGALVRLPQGTILVTARPLAGGRGAVATFVELERARQLAVKVSSARPRYGFEDVIGRSERIQEAIRFGKQVAALDTSVLITGESGTGKEVFAQAIHTAGPREGEPFVGINCAALPRELLEAELFGYEKGAFTGARAEGALGKFELAGEGTLLLDEIGDMPLDMQVKLLRVLQERTVVRLGGSQERPVRARIIATTLQDLDSAVQRGQFRLDLLFRLRVLHIHLPPLRERPEDIEALAHYFLERTARAQGKQVAELGPAVTEALHAYPWPGNIRELANVIEREVSLLPAEVPVLNRFQVPLSPPGGRSERPSSGKLPTAVRAPSSPELTSTILPLAEVERRAYLDAFHAFGGNVTRAARALGVSKVTFYTKLRQWGMHPADEPGPETLRRIRISESGGDPEGGSP